VFRAGQEAAEKTLAGTAAALEAALSGMRRECEKIAEEAR